MKFKLAPVAKNDVLEITDYYTDISAQLNQSLRSWRLDRFPFMLFYHIDGVWIDVLRVLHERRDISADLITETPPAD